MPSTAAIAAEKVAQYNSILINCNINHSAKTWTVPCNGLGHCNSNSKKLGVEIPLEGGLTFAGVKSQAILQNEFANGSQTSNLQLNNIKSGDVVANDNEVPSVSVILTIRLLMQGKEVGSIIGKRGDHVKHIRETSGGKVNISDGSCPERIVTITGNTSSIDKAFSMILRKFEEDLQALPNSVPKPPITMRLIVPATQCGSLIGKGGSKIKEIREKTGASIQVATEMLPSSTERAVTISGTCESLLDCMQEVCQILLEAPPKGATLPFRPKPTYNPLLIASSAAAAQKQASQHIAATIFQQQQQNTQQHQAAAAQAQQQFSAAGALNAFGNIPTTVSGITELTRFQPFVDNSPSINRNTANFNFSTFQDSNLNNTNAAVYLNAFSAGGMNGFPTVVSPHLLMSMNYASEKPHASTSHVLPTPTPTQTAAGNFSAVGIQQALTNNAMVFATLPPFAQQQTTPPFDPSIIAATTFLQQQKSNDFQNSNFAVVQPSTFCWPQQPFIGWDKQHQIPVSLMQQQPQFDFLQSLNYPASYIINPSVMSGRTMTVNGTSLKVPNNDLTLAHHNVIINNNKSVDLTSAASKSSRNILSLSDSRSKRFSPY